MPFYVIPFDKDGVCEGPETRRHLLEAVARGVYTDVYIFSHGWNNDWTQAVRAYEGFLNGFMQMRSQHNLEIKEPYRPLLVGIFWPSSALVFTDAELGPDIAAGDADAVDQAVAIERQAVRDLAAELPRAQRPRFYALVQRESLDAQEARELAEMVQELYQRPDDEMGADDSAVPSPVHPDETQTAESPPDGTPVDSLTPEQILEIWQSAAAPVDDEDEEEFGTVGGAADGPQAAGFLGRFDPRNILRMLTVYQMKDRAGTVGAFGVGPLLRDLLRAKDLRLHLLGHSFGGKVMLSAIVVGEDFAHGRKVDSLMLLQPAVSHLCFAERVPGTNRPGGYHTVFSRVRKPILSTFSRQDWPLHHFFHLALRRSADLGEARIAADGHPEPPNPYAALGGYGPRQAGEELLHIQAINEAYPLDQSVGIYGINGSGTITGHGDISRAETWWALYCLVAAGRE